jgi:hypothetical protein
MIFSENPYPPIGSSPRACFSGSCPSSVDRAGISAWAEEPASQPGVVVEPGAAVRVKRHAPVAGSAASPRGPPVPEALVVRSTAPAPACARPLSAYALPSSGRCRCGAEVRFRCPRHYASRAFRCLGAYWRPANRPMDFRRALAPRRGEHDCLEGPLHCRCRPLLPECPAAHGCPGRSPHRERISPLPARRGRRCDGLAERSLQPALPGGHQ